MRYKDRIKTKFKYIQKMLSIVKMYIAKLMDGNYTARICMIFFVALFGVSSTLEFMQSDKLPLVLITIVILIMVMTCVIISLIEAKSHENGLLVVLDFISVVVAYASVFSALYSQNSSTFSVLESGIVYIDFLYYSIATFITATDNNITPLTYISKFLSISESFFFICIISTAILNFSGPLENIMKNSENELKGD